MSRDPLTKENAEQLLARDEKFVVRPWSGSGEPVPIVSGDDCKVTDAFGTEFLDFTSGYFVNQVGHCHPRVTKAVTEQLGKITQVSGRHLTPAAVDLAEKLVTRAPSSVHKVFFTTGGTEANENALKMSRQATGKTHVASLENAYHGLTLGVLGGCAAKKYRDTAGVPVDEYFFRVPTAYCYRCEFQNNCKVQCLDGVEKQFEDHPQTTAVIAEPIQAVGGLAPPQAWWDRLDKVRKKHKAHLILDEIQTGCGRTGKFYATEHYGLEPDIITAGKGISGAVGSLGAVLVSEEIESKYYGGTTPTNAGNAVSCAAGNALIDVLDNDKLIENCSKMGKYFTEAVAALNDPWVGDIRFHGLLGGVELVTNRESKEILPKPKVLEVKDHLHKNGMLLTVSGLHGNVLRLQPPLSVTTAILDTFVASLGRALVAVRG